MSTVVFLGGGRITSAMVAGLLLSKTHHHLVVHDRHPAKLRYLKKNYGVKIEVDLHRALDQADILIIAVRPNSIPELLIAASKTPRSSLAISVAAGVPLKDLRKMAHPNWRWSRAMPSPLCRGGRGLTALTFPSTLKLADRQSVRKLFSSFGQILEIRESKFDAFTVTYSCSHGYHALATLTNAAQAIGLDRHMALLASAHALADGVIAWRDGSQSLESLLEEAVTPGGIAAAAAVAMDAAGYKHAVKQGLFAGLRRARANARK